MRPRLRRVASGLSLVLLAACASVVGLDDYGVVADGIDGAPSLDATVTPPPANVVVDAPTDAATFTCPDGEVVSVDRCFFLNAAPLAQPMAKIACVEAGAHLAVIRDEAENTRVATLGVELEAGRWIGLEAPGGSRNDAAAFVWITGAPIDYTNWHDGDPNVDAGCAAFFQGGPTGTPRDWVDRACTETLPSICQRQ